MKAYHFSQDFSRNGIPMWWDESDEVAFETEKRISKSAAALKRAEDAETGKDKTPPPGRYYIPIPKKIGGGKMPSFAEWKSEQARKKGQK